MTGLSISDRRTARLLIGLVVLAAGTMPAGANGETDCHVGGFIGAEPGVAVKAAGDAFACWPYPPGLGSAGVIGLAATAGEGYWLAWDDGGVFSFGDAGFFGSAADLELNAQVVGVAASPSGGGYWLAAADGGVFAFGDAGFFGSAADLELNASVVGVAASPSGGGYWLAAADGGVFAFGDAPYLEGAVYPTVAIASRAGIDGYWITMDEAPCLSPSGCL